MDRDEAWFEQIQPGNPEVQTFFSQFLKVTVSAGLSTLEYVFSEEKKINDSEIENCFKKLQCEADDALYMAKYKGKDQYCIYEKGKEKEYLEVREKYMK